MYKKLQAKFKKLARRKQGVVFGSFVLLVILLLFSVMSLTRPERSVTAYCKVYKEQVMQLGDNGGTTDAYSTSVFPNASSNDPGYFIPTFDKLDAVAPKEIEPQVKAMRDIFAKMQSDPTQTFSLALNGLPAEQAVTQWTQQHCRK